MLVNILQNINVWSYFIALTSVISYFMSICFYLEAICADFETVIRDMDNSIGIGHDRDAMLTNLILAIQLQTYVAE